MSDAKTIFTSKTIIIAMVVVLIFSFAIFLSRIKTNPANPKLSATPAAVKSTAKSTPSPSLTPIITSELPKIRPFVGTIKEVKKASIVIIDPAGKEAEVGFDSSTKILMGAGDGVEASAKDLAAGLMVGALLPEDKDNNIAQRIQMVVKTPAK